MTVAAQKRSRRRTGGGSEQNRGIVFDGIVFDVDSGSAGAYPVVVNAKSGSLPAVTRRLSQLQEKRLQKLAKSINELADKDRSVIERTRAVHSLRRQSALELHALCTSFAGALNDLLPHPALELNPEELPSDYEPDPGVQLFQINARGRILQITFEATPELFSTEDFRLPYILHGAIRCFNQQTLEQSLIDEQSLFCTLEKAGSRWRYFDPRTYRSGDFDLDYLISLMEKLV